MRYFFHISPGPPSDEDGEELPGVEEARSVALEMVRQHPPRVDERIVVINERVIWCMRNFFKKHHFSTPITTPIPGPLGTKGVAPTQLR